MRKWLLLLTIVASSCGSRLSELNETALKAAENGLNEKEYQEIVSIVKESPRDFKSFYTANKLDEGKLTEYLNRLLQSKGFAPLVASANTSVSAFNVNIYIENSISVNGYVNESATFRTKIFKLLTDLKGFKSSKSLKLNYINTKDIPVFKDAGPNEIKDFYDRLNPNDFKRAGGNIASTDIENMFHKVLDRTDADNLNVFISDCIFSPGKKDPLKFLDGQYAAIYNDVKAARARMPDLAIMVLQCFATFDGVYYDLGDKPHKGISGQRPYYIWFMGSQRQIQSLLDNNLLALLKDGYENKILFLPQLQTTKPSYKISYSPKIGDFNLESGSGPITKARLSSSKQDDARFGFDIKVDFSKSVHDLAYFDDPSNYNINSEFRLSVMRNTQSSSSEPYTHILRLRSNVIRDQALDVNVIGRMPKWVESSTSTDDTKIETEKDEMKKTFGLMKLISGVSDAFYPNGQLNKLYNLSVTIKTK